MSAKDYDFRAATLDDLPMLRAWQAMPHVRAWWEDDEPYDAAHLEDPRVVRLIVSHGGRPFAYIQDYTVHGWDGHPFAHLPNGSRGIDQYIGDPAMVGVGHGTAFIAARMRALFDAGAPVIAIDPHPDNARAIAVYREFVRRFPAVTRAGLGLGESLATAPLGVFIAHGP